MRLPYLGRVVKSLAIVFTVLSLLIFPLSSVNASAQLSWQLQTASEASGWESIVWSPELDLFVAVAFSGANRVMTSPDGITWTSHSAAEANTWQDVAWSPELDLFVAVANSGTNRVMTSPDGINWTARAAAQANDWRAVAWSPELSIFTAVAFNGTNRVMTSPDGITWTAQTAAEANTWQGVTWASGLGLFVAVSQTGTNRVMTSPDGINWTARAAGNGLWWDVTWSQDLGLLVAVAINDPDRIMTSPDGITWTARTTPSDSGWTSVSWVPEIDLFVATGIAGDSRIMTSPNGITWTAYTAPQNNPWYDFAWSPELEMLVAVAAGGTNRVMTTIPSDNDGISNSIEAAAPNGGDANNDGNGDKWQGYVASFVNPATTSYATLALDSACDIVAAAAAAESSNTVTDPAYNYPAGLMNFTADCGTPGFTATVTQYYYGLTTNGLVLRKYNPNTGAYSTVDGAAITQDTIGGQAVTKVEYQVTDGGPLDTDGIENGIIIDPVGVALEAGTAAGPILASTGSSQQYIMAFGVVAVAMSSALIVVRKVTKTHSDK